MWVSERFVLHHHHMLRHMKLHSFFQKACHQAFSFSFCDCARFITGGWGVQAGAGVYILRYGHLVRNNTIVTSPYQRSTSELLTTTQLRRDDSPGNVVVVVVVVSLDVVGHGLPFSER